MNDRVRHIAIEVSSAGDELQGRVGDGVQEPRAFSGWLGLLAALDALMDAPRHESAVPSAGTPDRAMSAREEEWRCS